MINIRTIKKLTNNDGITLKGGKIIEYKTGWQVAVYGVKEALKIGREHNQISIFGWTRKNLAYC